MFRSACKSACDQQESIINNAIRRQYHLSVNYHRPCLALMFMLTSASSLCLSLKSLNKIKRAERPLLFSKSFLSRCSWGWVSGWGVSDVPLTEVGGKERVVGGWAFWRAFGTVKCKITLPVFVVNGIIMFTGKPFLCSWSHMWRSVYLLLTFYPMATSNRWKI